MAQDFEQKTEFIRVIEASYDELLAFRYATEFKDPLIAHYAEILIAYLSGETPTLHLLLERISELQGDERLKEIFTEITMLRLQIRERRVQTLLAEQVANRAVTNELWSGELLFVAAMAFETTEDNLRSKELYRRSAIALEKTGARRKAVKATLNHVVAESRIHPEKKLLNEYLHVYRRAKKLHMNGVAGVALLNVSREFQRISAIALALKYCNRSLALQRSEHATLPYYLTLTHRCHLLCQLGRDQEALLDFEQAMMSGFPEVREALKVVEALRQGTPESPAPHSLTPTWKERLSQFKVESPEAAEPLGELEERVIQLIAEAPRDKFALIEALYGLELSLEVTENRLKNLLSRLRRKRPGLLIFEDGRYRISDDVFLTEAG